MILRQGHIACDPRDASDMGALDQIMLSDAGGLTQIGVYLETLHPGAQSSDRHWHEAEDELLYVLSGEITVTDNHGPHLLTAGDAVAWPHGAPNAHHVKNLRAKPASYLILGSRVARDICHYPDTGRRQVNLDSAWQVEDSVGKILRSGDLPPELLKLPAVWGTPYDGNDASRILCAADRKWVSDGPQTHPALGETLGPYAHCILGTPGGLSQFGMHLERLPPGSQSSFRHWHEAEDEMVYVLSGHPTLIEDTRSILAPGDAAVWSAGRAVGHCLRNDTAEDTTYLTIGTRLADDRIHYPDHDLITHKNGLARRYTHGDGTDYRRKT